MVKVGMKDKEVGFASWFDDMNRGCKCWTFRTIQVAG
jgi:hypothetical protein